MKVSLVIMAAGIGSRFGGGVKQLEPVGQNGELIIDFSIHDAIEAGFNKIVFIIRKDIEKDFREVIGDRIEEICNKLNVEICYVYQDINNIPKGFSVPSDRKKPWGTGQAVLACEKVVNEPFAVINADDYYGKEAFKKVYKYLVTEAENNKFCMAGFVLKNTLSENGGVTRGICNVDENDYLSDIVETKNVMKTENGVFANNTEIDENSYVSMNMWGLTPEFIQLLDKGFVEFFENDVKKDPLGCEYLLPIYIGELLKNNSLSVKVLKTNDKWFGVTYKEDKESVIENFKELLNKGVYNMNLFGDLIK